MRNRGILIGVFLAAGLATGCGSLLPNQNTATQTSTSVSSLAVGSISPASGSYATQPTQIQVNFSETDIDINSASTLTNYTISCGSSSAYATAVSYLNGNSYVNVTLPALTFNSGTTCQFIVGAVADIYGSGIGGNRQAAYVITSGASNFTWTEQGTPIYLTAEGSQSGVSFNQVGALGSALSGFNLLTGTNVFGVQGVWTSSSGTPVTGAEVGAAGTNTVMSCPSGERITGLYGYYGTYLNGIGIYCNNASMTSGYQSGIAGTATGLYFSESCTPGEFATAIYGLAGSYMGQLGLGCQ